MLDVPEAIFSNLGLLCLAHLNNNKEIRKIYVACRSDDVRPWIIAARDLRERFSASPPCPCMLSDPNFPGCPPGATVRVRGGVWFSEGTDIDAENRRIDGTASSGASGR